MRIRHFAVRTDLPVPAEEAYRWHARPGALERLTPAWAGVRVVRRPEGIADGARAILRVPVGPFRVAWEARHSGTVEGRRFVDEQVRGPFARWVHVHRFEPGEAGGSVLHDEIEYALPFGPAGDLLARKAVAGMLKRLFAHRHAVTAADLDCHLRFPGRDRLRVAVTGSTGFIGGALAAFLSAGGHEVIRLVRPGRAAGVGSIAWDPAAGAIDAASLEGIDAVVHLAGENIGSGRWTPERKGRILRSRTDGTGLLAGALAGLRNPPRVLLSASAIGIYGDRGDEELDEHSPSGQGFLAEVSKAWEAGTSAAAAAGVRVVHLRTGVVLSAGGGALARMLPPYRLGGGGPVGSGSQFVSWISLQDAVAAIHFALFRDDVEGPLNLTAPAPVPQGRLARALGEVLGRPAVARLPAAAVRLVFGEMGEALLLEGQRALPRRLLATGFRFRFPTLEDALRFELGRGFDPGPGTSFREE